MVILDFFASRSMLCLYGLDAGKGRNGFFGHEQAGLRQSDAELVEAEGPVYPLLVLQRKVAVARGKTPFRESAVFPAEFPFEVRHHPVQGKVHHFARRRVQDHGAGHSAPLCIFFDFLHDGGPGGCAHQHDFVRMPEQPGEASARQRLAVREFDFRVLFPVDGQPDGNTGKADEGEGVVDRTVCFLRLVGLEAGRPFPVSQPSVDLFFRCREGYGVKKK